MLKEIAAAPTCQDYCGGVPGCQEPALLTATDFMAGPRCRRAGTLCSEPWLNDQRPSSPRRKPATAPESRCRHKPEPKECEAVTGLGSIRHRLGKHSNLAGSPSCDVAANGTQTSCEVTQTLAPSASASVALHHGFRP